MSLLGLIRWAELGLMKDVGRRDCDSAPDDELRMSMVWMNLGTVRRVPYAMYCAESAGDSGPEESDIS